MSGHSSRPDSRPQRRAHSSREEAKLTSFFKRAAAALRTFIVISFAFTARFLKDYEMRSLFSRKNVKEGEKSCRRRKRRHAPPPGRRLFRRRGTGAAGIAQGWRIRSWAAPAKSFPPPCAADAKAARRGTRRSDASALRQNAKKPVESGTPSCATWPKVPPYPFSASSRALR